MFFSGTINFEGATMIYIFSLFILFSVFTHAEKGPCIYRCTDDGMCGYYTINGNSIRPGESPEEALDRILAEEKKGSKKSSSAKKKKAKDIKTLSPLIDNIMDNQKNN